MVAQNQSSFEPYGSFAEIYDQIMCSVDYEGWADYVEALLKIHAGNQVIKDVIDLACGTGSSTIPFARRGYRVVGLDISETMLKLAHRKTEEQNLSILYHRQDLRCLCLNQKFDLALLFQDGLNYILSEPELYKVFCDLYASLKCPGFFVFDLTRPGLRSQNIVKDDTCVVDLEELTLIMESHYQKEKELWSASLTVFQKLKNGLYKKYREEHQEKDYAPVKIKEMLKRAGFSVTGIYPSFSLQLTGEQDLNQKLTFVAKKSAGS